jgi:hypothetical protein
MVPRPQVNLRLDPHSAALLEALEDKLNLNASNVLRLALARLAELENIKLARVDE